MLLSHVLGVVFGISSGTFNKLFVSGRASLGLVGSLDTAILLASYPQAQGTMTAPSW